MQLKRRTINSLKPLHQREHHFEKYLLIPFNLPCVQPAKVKEYEIAISVAEKQRA
jgi:hypothetical protein